MSPALPTVSIKKGREVRNVNQADLAQWKADGWSVVGQEDSEESTGSWADCTVRHLKDVAENNGVELPARAKKAEIIAILEDAGLDPED